MNTIHPIVMTLDAGGTNMVFSAIQGGKEIVNPITFPSITDDLTHCLEVIKKGFETVILMLPDFPSAISFAFPGPADYESGIIGDLPNFPAFRGGIALGPFLENYFGIPVFINNDGNLFAYGEALAGTLPDINTRLKLAGNSRCYKNLIGVTLGTGFGGGIVINGELLRGDNQVGGNLWCMPNKLYPGMIAEESVSIRAIQRVYKSLSGDTKVYSPKDIFDIAEGKCKGDSKAAIAAFAEMGEVAGYAIASVITLIDGLVVIGGGVSGASKYILPAFMKELQSDIGMLNGTRWNRMLVKAYNLQEPQEMKSFLQRKSKMIDVPFTDKKIEYQTDRSMGVIISKLGASRAISLGAYWFAVNELKKKD